ncbi:MAG: MerR family transcriptional regulator [Pseudomonadota bacterium]
MAPIKKSSEAFRTISEVAEILDVPAHVLRFWESRFTQIKPIKRGGGRRYYRPQDIDLLSGIQNLLYNDGLTIKGVQKQLKEQGVRQIAALTTVNLNGAGEAPGPDAEPAPKAAEKPAAPPPPKPTHKAPAFRLRTDQEAEAPEEMQFDLFAREEEKTRRPFPPDPRREAKREEIRAILAKLLRLRERMAGAAHK